MDAYGAFAAIYDQWSASMTEDVPFFVELARAVDSEDSREYVWVTRRPA